MHSLHHTEECGQWMQASALLLKFQELSDLQFLRPFDTGSSADEQDINTLQVLRHDDAPWPMDNTFTGLQIKPLASTSIPDCCDIQLEMESVMDTS